MTFLGVAGVADGGNYPTWAPSRRRPLLETELAARRPFAPADGISWEATAVIGVYQRLAEPPLAASATLACGRADREYDPERRGPPCRLRARPGRRTQPGSWRATGVGAPRSGSAVRDDRRPRARADHHGRLPRCRGGPREPPASAGSRGLREPVQQVVGYSDSGKDGGIARSFWSLYRGQVASQDRAEARRARFFHGQGGPSVAARVHHRFVKALPVRTVGGDLRLTEQGETIAQKYALDHGGAPPRAAVGGNYVRDRGRRGRPEQSPPELLELMDELAQEKPPTSAQAL